MGKNLELTCEQYIMLLRGVMVDNEVFVESKCLNLLWLRIKALNCFQQFQKLVCIILGNISNHLNLSQCYIMWRFDLLESNVLTCSKPTWKCKVSKLEMGKGIALSSRLQRTVCQSNVFGNMQPCVYFSSCSWTSCLYNHGCKHWNISHQYNCLTGSIGRTKWIPPCPGYLQEQSSMTFSTGYQCLCFYHWRLSQGTYGI